MRDLHEVAVAYAGSADDVRPLLVQSGAVRKQAGFVRQAVRLAQGRIDPKTWLVELPVHAVSKPNPVFHPVVSGEAVQGEEVGILKVDGARILIRDGEVADRRAGDQLDARGQHLRAVTEGLTHQRPAHVHRADCDGARLPARIAAIGRSLRRQHIVRMVDVCAAQRGEGQFLPPWRNAAEIELSAAEGALCILPVGTVNTQRIGLQFHARSGQRPVHPASVVDDGQRKRDKALVARLQQQLRGPAFHHEIAVVVDPLYRHVAAQPVVAADVVAAQESAVAGHPDGALYAPVRVELPLAVGKQVAAEIFGSGGDGCAEGNARAVSRVARDLVSPALRQLAVLRGDHRRGLGIDIARKDHVAAFTQALVIAAGKLETVGSAVTDIGNQEPGFGLAVRAKRQARQRQDAQSEKLEPRSGKLDALRIGIVDDPLRRYAPARRFRAAIRILDRAAGIDGAVQFHAAIVQPPPLNGRQPTAFTESEEEVLHRSGAQFVRQLDGIGKQLVAVLVHQPDIALRLDYATGAIPRDLVRAHGLVAALQQDIAAGSDGVRRVVIAEFVRFEGHLPLAGIIEFRDRSQRHFACGLFIGAGGQRIVLHLLLRGFDTGCLPAILRRRDTGKAEQRERRASRAKQERSR